MKKGYTEAKLEIVEFGANDVIVTSLDDGYGELSIGTQGDFD